MADLRTALYTGNGNLSADQLARIDAADMGTLRRSYTGGRITNDINPMLADIASLEADGTPEARTKAAGLRDQVSALEQRRAAYAPEVGKVENINGIGSGLTWAGEQVGQGVASMQDMMLTGAGLTAAGRAVGAIPHPIARAAGMALQGGGVLAPYLMNQRQLAGEAYGDMTEDPALMARTTPQQRYEMARNYGALAAIPDTALPALVGRQLAGAGLRKGLSKIGPAAMTGLELLGEGTTELGQEVGKQYALGQLNPERDTSQDASANLNSFLGGAVGAGPFAAAGAYADAGYRRVGDTAEKIGTKAGQVVDLAGQKLGPMAEEVAKKGRGWIGAGKEKVDTALDSFKGEDGRIDLSKVVAAGKETAGEVRDNAARAVFGITPQERSILEGGTAESIPADIAMDPDPQKAVAWVAQNDRDRVGLVTDRLSSIDDPQAIDIFDRIVAAGDAQDPGAQRLAVDEGAKYLLDRAEEIKFANRAERIAQTAGSAAAAAGKGAFEFGKAVVDGVKKGLSKKNAQVEPWEQRKADMQAARRSAPAERLAQLWSEALAAAAPQSTIGEKGTALFRSLGERIADLTEVSPPLNQINRIAQDVRVGFGKNAEQILDNLASMGDKKSAPTIEAIRAAVVAGRTPAGQRQIAQERQAVSGQLLALLPIEQAKSIIANGQQMDLLEHIEDFADGHAAPALRPALEAAVGKENLTKMVDLVNGVTKSKDRGNEALLEARDDDVTDYELRQAEKKSVKGSGPKIYGVSKSPVLRDNPFAPNKRMSKEKFQRWMDDEIQRKSEGLPPQIEPEFERPMLFKTGDPQLDARIAHMDEKLDSTYHIAPRSAWEVMDDTDMPLARRLATYRDYMREDGQGTGMIQKALLDAMDGHDFGEWANPAGGTSAEQQRGSGAHNTAGRMGAIDRDQARNMSAGMHNPYRQGWDDGSRRVGLNADRNERDRKGLPPSTSRNNAPSVNELESGSGAAPKGAARLTTGQRNVLFNEMQAYFSERHLAVAEQIADREPSRIGRTELLSMVRAGKRAFGLHRMKDNPDEHLDQSNLLMFKSEMANQKTGAPGVIYIPVHQLVKWVQAQRERSETVEVKKDDEKDKTYSNRNKNEAYLADVMEGISIILNSGMVEDQLPARVEGLSQGKKPKLAPFTEQNIPKNLRLATMTYGQMMFRLEKKNANITRAEVPAGPPAPAHVIDGVRGKDARADKDYQNAVRRDQNRNEDFFEPDPLPEVDPEVQPRATAPLTADEQALFDTLTTAEQRKLFWNERRLRGKLRTEGAQFSTQPTVSRGPRLRAKDVTTSKGEPVYMGERQVALNPAGPRTDDANATPLDFFSDIEKPAVPDEFDDQQFRTKNGGKSAYLPLPAESKMNAWKDADKNADALLNKFRKYVETNVGGKIVRTPIESDVAGGLAEIEQRLRAAKTPSYNDGKYRNAKAKPGTVEAARAAGAVGGLHYAIPLAQVLNPDVISTMDIVDADAQRIVAARAELAGLVRDAKGFSDAQRVRLTRAMAPAESAARITLANYRKALEKAINAAPTANIWYGTGENAEFSNLASRPFNYEGHNFVSVEHAYQSLKSGQFDAETAGKYTAAGKKIAGRLGTKTEGGWNIRLMEKLVEASYRQNPDAAKKLLATGSTTLTHDQDTGVWKTEFPRILMDVRDKLRTLKTEASKTEASKAAASKDALATAITLRQNYLDNPPADYSADTVRGIIKWAERQAERVAAAAKELDGSEDFKRVDEVNDRAIDLRVLIKSAKESLTRDEAAQAAPKARYSITLGDDGIAEIDGKPASPNEARAAAAAAKKEGGWTTYHGPNGDFVYQKESYDAAPEVAAQSPKSSSAPGGGKLESRVEGAASWATGIPVEALELAQDIGMVAPAKAATAWRRGETKQQFMAGATGVSILAQTLALRLQGHEATADKLWGRFTGIVDQTYALPYDRDLEDALNSRLVASPRGAALSSFLQEYAVSDLPAGPKVIARAVSKIAGAEVVKLGNIKADGEFNTVNGGITVSRMKTLGTAATVLHEGVHAATAAAIVANPELSRALYRLLAHVTSHNPQLAQVYGTTNTLEFLAEGLSNMSFQRELYKIPANETVAKYLGRTVANAWEAFVTIVRKALNIPAIHDSALTQLISLGGQAMKETAALGTTSTREAFSAYAVRGMVPLKQFEQLVAETAAHPKLSAAGSAHFAKFMMRDLHVNDGKVPHSEVLSTTIAKKLLDYTAAAPGSLGAEFIDRILVPAVRTATLRTPPAALPNAMAADIHRDLNREGFAATHDSPIKHEGKFDWRAHQGKGEGNAAFGAGTYLSTADGVHRSYKRQFSGGNARSEYLRRALEEVNESLRADRLELTAKEKREYVEENLREYLDGSDGWLDQDIYDALRELKRMSDEALMKDKSPTYEVSVNIRPEQLLDWDAPLSEQSDLVKKAAARAAGVGKLSKWVTRPDNTWESTDGVHAYYIYKSADGGYFLMQNYKHIADVKTLSQAQERAHREAMRSVTGQAVYTALAEMLGSQAKASDYLQSLGILGHKYAAVGGKNDTHPNYVIYDDSKITTNYVHFNAQDRAGGPRVASDADIAEAKAYFHKVLGPKVKVLFKEITGYSGEWLDAENTAVISTMAAAGTMQTAYHEALHAFFSKYVKGDPKVLPIMKALAENERVLERVKALLHEYPAALAQLADGEERLAYIYQFWAAGLLKLGPGPGRTWLQKLGKFFRGVLGLVSDSERAVDLLEAFHAGKMAEPSAAGRVIAKLTAQPVTVKVRRKLDGLSQLVAAATLPAESILLNSPSAAVRALGRKFFSNPGDEEAGKYPEAYLNARKRESIKYHGVFARAVAGLDSSDLKEVAKYLQQGTDPANIPYKPHADAVRGVREALDRFYTYMKDEKGLSVGYIERYYPVIWSTDILHDKKDEFIKMLTDNYGDILAKGVASSKGNLDEAGVAERIWAALIRNGGGDNKIAPARSDGVLVPYFESGEHRVLNWIKPEHREPFLQKDLIGQISKYFHEGARKAEYQSRFGEHGEKLSELLDPQKKAFDELRWADANKDGPPPGLLDVEYVTKPGQKTLIIATFAGTAETELMAEADKMVARGELKNATAAKKWVARQMRDVRQAVGALEGTLGKDIPEGWRKFNSWMTVYQNVRLLPLALFSSIVDPLGMVARGAELKDAYAAFLAGMKEVVRAWGNEFRDEPKASGLDPKWTRLAEAVGATEAELFAHHVSEEFSSDYMVRGAKTINDKMFILNGMEAWNRAMRIAATKAAVEFIMKHKGLPDKIHSARWLQELGLKPEDIVLNADGELVTDRHELARLKNIPLEQATKEMQRTHWAINRWVEGAILTPNAAQRPSWSSDPRWGIFFHLKQFTYSFHYTLMKRAVKELEYGNLAPIGAFAWYIPVMLASDITRGLIQGGGELPAYMKGWDVGDHLINATQRAGFLSVGQIGVDAVADPASLGGPAIEQMIDAMRDPLEHSTIKALPLQPIFRNAALN